MTKYQLKNANIYQNYDMISTSKCEHLKKLWQNINLKIRTFNNADGSGA